MNDLFISISTAIKQIDTAVSAKGNKGTIGYVLRKYKLFDLSAYEINQENKQIQQLNPILFEAFCEYFQDKYPPKPTTSTLYDIVPKSIFAFEREAFDLSEHFWRIDEFEKKAHKIFAITNTPIISYQVNQDVQELQAQVQDLQQQLQEKDEQIQTLANQLKEKQAHSPIFDKSHEYFAPDLAHAVNLWLGLYDNGKSKDDSHSNQANQWINNNTGYDKDSDTRTIERIREITTPFKSWGQNRSREKK